MRVFAGGDAKLMIALGAILPFSESFFSNIKIYLLFLCIFFVTGSLYGFVYSFVLASKNFRRFKSEFLKQAKSEKKRAFIFFILGGVLLLLGFIEFFFVYFSFVFFAFPVLYVYAKSVEEGSMIHQVKPSELTEGDWLYADLKIGKKTIKAKWDGLSKREIEIIKKKFKKVRIKKGIPFVPVFFVSFLVFIAVCAYFPFEAYGILLGSHIFPLGLSIFSIF
jgi:hypothetical protein